MAPMRRKCDPREIVAGAVLNYDYQSECGADGGQMGKATSIISHRVFSAGHFNCPMGHPSNKWELNEEP
jgi:hypothetical protein